MGASLQARRASDHCPTDPAKRCELADTAARAAVVDVFAILGVNVEDPVQVKKLQQSIWLSDDLVKARAHGVLVIIGLAAAALWGLIAAGAKIKLGG
jgi:hypothetical protein